MEMVFISLLRLGMTTDILVQLPDTLCKQKLHCPPVAPPPILILTKAAMCRVFDYDVRTNTNDSKQFQLSAEIPLPE